MADRNDYRVYPLGDQCLEHIDLIGGVKGSPLCLVILAIQTLVPFTLNITKVHTGVVGHMHPGCRPGMR